MSLTPEQEKFLAWILQRCPPVNGDAYLSPRMVVKIVDEYRDYLAFTSGSEPVTYT